MEKKRVLLPVKRFKQQPSECAIAAASSLANYYDDSITYKEVRELIPAVRRKQGLWSSQQGRLLNSLGFTKITIVTAELSLVDFSWADLSKEELLKKLRKLKAYWGRSREWEVQRWVNDLIEWLADDNFDNQIKISQDFSSYIKRYLNNGRPVGASFNWTALHKFKKATPRKGKSPWRDIGGEVEEHAVVIRGYDEKGVFIVDSHTKHYNGKHAKLKNGYYKVNWERFLVNAPYGDLILVG